MYFIFMFLNFYVVNSFFAVYINLSLGCKNEKMSITQVFNESNIIDSFTIYHFNILMN